MTKDPWKRLDVQKSEVDSQNIMFSIGLACGLRLTGFPKTAAPRSKVTSAIRLRTQSSSTPHFVRFATSKSTADEKIEDIQELWAPHGLESLGL